MAGFEPRTSGVWSSTVQQVMPTLQFLRKEIEDSQYFSLVEMGLSGWCLATLGNIV